MKKFYFLLLLSLLVISCKKSDEIDARSEFVGIYSLEVRGSIEVTNGSKTEKLNMDDYGRRFNIYLDWVNDNRLLVDGYYGSRGAYLLSPGVIRLESSDSDILTKYENGYISQLRMHHGEITTDKNGKLQWETIIDVVATYNGKSAIGVGILKNVATKIE